ncbi:pentatricopeptide repeat-containing protein At3g09040, mitochondrial-like [Vitis riparia]|uniref:pentatricopeptide repeat-containing protein At3g09040, mitochondrial-like n=1 Tax=Vitis riparia TaxID=96939 RepID=UPI00155A372E|nr:pentatricopeptide repeat-containing protein At3g09040, mitochondrial-like [Vitis riparia]XP_034697591.1 pentatricopeptide repeat-containing protein At3g09040, mitochondrial-like [Vitis riparia]XP_034697593.1 pentatricopeptide repeat-containing protein At3g09040, mitochondrial-like [Vitis riparia]XP_034697594.1 pentatricopeptide repeat-containing protein At3g09040, mitochondrial-like [Vitis riparia]XP_034697595.1 pentatricopeptide repeat-containing protein At3g09040, mitochondrial-like [Vitis
MRGSTVPFVSKLNHLSLFTNKMLRNQHHVYASKSCNCSSSLSFRNDPTALSTALTHSANSKCILLGSQIHAQIIKLGFCNDIFSQNNLIKMYTKCGFLAGGLKVFGEMPMKNLVSWTLVVSGAVQNGEFEMGLGVYLEMIRTGLVPNEFALGCVTKACAALGGKELGLCVHCFALKVGMEKNPFVGSSILNMYAKLGDIEDAERVFECMDNLVVGCWNAMIGGYAQCSYGFESLKIVSLMQYKGISMDAFTFINALKGCLVVGNLNFGRQIHGLIIQSEVGFSTAVMNSLMDMYFKNGGGLYALKVFDRLQDKDIISWNTVFAGLSQGDDAREIGRFFHKLMLTGLKPNCVTFSILFRFCGEALDLVSGLQFYCLAFQFGISDEASVTSSLINMFSKCGAMRMACLVFDSAPFKSIHTCNEMISGYNLNCHNADALNLFCNLNGLGLEADECTFSSALEACFRTENQKLGRQMHGTIVKSGFASQGYVCSSLLKCYVGFGLLDDSFEFFNGVERLDLVSWGAMISALVHKGYSSEAIGLLNRLKEAGGKPDEFIFGSIFNCCAGIAAYRQTKSVHSLVVKMGYEAHVFVASAVIDAYAKCGDIENARRVFDQTSRFRDVILFNTMVIAYAHHGLVREAVETFEKMKLATLEPSQATFVSVISACSHLGLVEQGDIFFKSMNLDYGMDPSPDNYGCLVDLFSRNGFLEDAKHIIETMPFPPWPAIWRSLLNGCRIHGNKELGEWAAKKLLQLVPENDAAYVLLSKVYSEEGSWSDAAKVRKGMIERGLWKDPGCSWIEI